MSNMTGNAADQAQSAARQVNDSVWFERGVRVGLVAYGIIHILIGWLALQLAFGDQSGTASSQGALRQIAQESYGEPLLWIIGLGMILLAVWQLFEAIWGHRSRDEPKRTHQASQLRRQGRPLHGDRRQRDQDRPECAVRRQELDRLADGRPDEADRRPVAGGRVGVVIIVVAVMQAKRGFTKSFTKDLQGSATSGDSGTAVVKFGQAGYISKGVALAAVGALFIWAAWEHDPKKAGGLDVALHKILDQAFGPILLAVVAVGIIAFGLYCFAWARYADTNS